MVATNAVGVPKALQPYRNTMHFQNATSWGYLLMFRHHISFLLGHCIYVDMGGANVACPCSRNLAGLAGVKVRKVIAHFLSIPGDKVEQISQTHLLNQGSARSLYVLRRFPATLNACHES